MRAYNSQVTVEEFIARNAKPYDAEMDNYFREPFARDTKVGKNSAIYNAHSYHTKVPPEGIVPYILHYTDPGDLILDPFCGSGMTGVAAMMCANPPKGIALPAGTRIGARRAILNDLSPAACHIAYNYTHPVDIGKLKAEFDRIMRELEPEFEWLYGTECGRCGGGATIQYTIWSDVFKCCRCGEAMVLWDVAVDHESGEVKDAFACPSCGYVGKKTDHNRFDSVPVVTDYECESGCKPKRSKHRTTDKEKQRIVEIEAKEIPYWYPTDAFGADREMWRGGHRDAGITHVCDFYTKRNLWALAAVWAHTDAAFRFQITAIARLASRMSKVGLGNYFNKAGGPINAGITSTLYLPSYSVEQSVAKLISSRFNKPAVFMSATLPIAVSCGSAASLGEISADMVDYIFTDPPFGSNIFYADCSILWESWLQQFTDVKQEAVWNKSLKPTKGGKTLDDYARIMAGAFAEMHRVLKPGRWASVVFSNSDDNVWQVIRDGAKAAGFDLANTLALDKKQRSFKQIKGEKGEENVVGTDIIMNLHKKARILMQVAEVPDLDATVLSIIRQHLEDLPPRIKADPRTYSDALRTTDALFSVVIQALIERHLSNRGLTMPYIDSLCAATFKKIEGHWYLLSEDIRSPLLVAEIHDEPTAIEWLRRRLEQRTMTFPELVPEWRQATLMVGNGISKGLKQLLQENFWYEPETNRWRLPTETERAKMGDERTLRMKRQLQQVIEGKVTPGLLDRELLDLMLFAYQEMADAKAAVAIYGRLTMSNLSEEDRKKATRIYKVSLVKAQSEEAVENLDDQLQLF